MKNGLSIADKLLVAALSLENQGKHKFSAEDLVVAAWKAYPDAFGLTGYVNESGQLMYPNSNRVYAEIMGTKPIREQGFLRKVGSKMYSLSETGRSRAFTLVDAPSATAAQKWSFAREKQVVVKRLMDSKAANKARAGKSDELTFFDACSFWGISPRTDAKDLISRFADIETILTEAIASMDSQARAASKHGGVEYNTSDLQALADLHASLKNRFDEDLGYIRRRTQER